jgi:hypothetical protein
MRRTLPFVNLEPKPLNFGNGLNMSKEPDSHQHHARGEGLGRAVPGLDIVGHRCCDCRHLWHLERVVVGRRQAGQHAVSSGERSGVRGILRAGVSDGPFSSAPNINSQWMI